MNHTSCTIYWVRRSRTVSRTTPLFSAISHNRIPQSYCMVRVHLHPHPRSQIFEWIRKSNENASSPRLSESSKVKFNTSSSTSVANIGDAYLIYDWCVTYFSKCSTMFHESSFSSRDWSSFSRKFWSIPVRGACVREWNFEYLRVLSNYLST
jgi:hypothetical protein